MLHIKLSLLEHNNSLTTIPLPRKNNINMMLSICMTLKHKLNVVIAGMLGIGVPVAKASKPKPTGKTNPTKIDYGFSEVDLAESLRPNSNTTNSNDG